MRTKKLTDAEILKTVLDKTRNTPYSLAKEIGVASPGLYQFVKGKQKLTNNVLFRIENKFPEINKYFLRYGEGSVLNYNTSTNGYKLKELKEVIKNLGVQLQEIEARL